MTIYLKLDEKIALMVGNQDIFDKAITLEHMHDFMFSKVAWNTFKKKNFRGLKDRFKSGWAFWAELRESGAIFKKALRTGELCVD